MNIHRISKVLKSHENDEGVIISDEMVCACGYEGTEDQLESHLLQESELTYEK